MVKIRHFETSKKYAAFVSAAVISGALSAVWNFRDPSLSVILKTCIWLHLSTFREEDEASRVNNILPSHRRPTGAGRNENGPRFVSGAANRQLGILLLGGGKDYFREANE